MIRCPKCSGEISDEATVFPSCGISLMDSFSPTRRWDTPKATSGDKEPSLRSASHPSIDDARFVAGAILVDRYRIVGLLGKGGMGEVYRADDLKLAQPVALKFLPSHLFGDGSALARFHREVRVARQVSHKNVCRVYDIGEVEGHHFLSMEYIKGEELSSLLRRIGRLPSDKATQLARQICAGLAAAHDAGVLHRDLKPANVMIDADGNARILDFGIAGLAGEFGEDELAAGTPAYMAPEQLDGSECTVRSDIYSLGLLRYELFTARRAYQAATPGELIMLRRSDATPTTPTSIVKDLDASIELVIDRCLRKDPAQRPASALQVAAALPGGDPIAAALAAGETPSPEMLAAAPTEGALKPAHAIGLLALVVGLLAFSAWVTKYTAIYRLSPIDQSPEVLRAHARDLINKLGYGEPARDSADGIILKEDYLAYISDHDRSPTRWQKMRTEGPGAYRYWYRQSPRYFFDSLEITPDRPALDVSGMTTVYLDMSGRLHWFVGVPPQREPPPGEKVTVDWSLPFREAGLDIGNFHSVPSTSVPLHAYDERAAWDGADPGHPELKTHVEAAAFRGKITYFETVYPWDKLTRQEQTIESTGNKVLNVLVIAVYLIVLVGSVLLAIRNFRSGKGDRRGAVRLALFYFTVRMLVWLFAEHHNGYLGHEFALLLISIATAVFHAGFLGVIYLALEPFVRRRWPHRIISWNRLLVGDFRDPLVGRDILIGAAFGLGITVLILLAFATMGWIGRPGEIALNPGSIVIGSHLFVIKFASQLTASLFMGFIPLFLLLLFVFIFRREWLALGMLWLLLTVVEFLLTQSTWLMLPFTACLTLLTIVVLARFGLLATISAMFFVHLWVYFPVTTELTAWYATDFVIALVISLALVGYGFYRSLAGQPLLNVRMLERDEA